jgi:FkbM family methyltransferase
LSAQSWTETRRRSHRPEARAVRVGRLIARTWPRTRGKGWIFRCLRPFLPSAHAVFEIEPGVYIEANLDDYLGRAYFLNGLRWQPSFLLSRTLIRPDDNIIDVGANVGFWVLGAAALGPRGTALALEPSPDLLAGLQRNACLNGIENLACLAVAASDREGEGRFLPNPRNSAHGALCPPETDERGITVPLTTLDALCRQRGLPAVDLLKIDVEGAEEAVLLGAQSTLNNRRPPVVLIEVGGHQADRYGSSASRVKALLATHGYSTYRFDGRHLGMVVLDAPHPITEDLFALKPSHFLMHPHLSQMLAGTVA